MKDSFASYDPESKKNAQTLRKRMTKEERHLWYDFLRTYPVRIYRQRAIDRYVVDFYCSKAKLVIELDGGQHFMTSGQEYDKIRSEVLDRYGISVLRFSNLEMQQNFAGVCAKIDRKIQERMKELE